MNYSIFAHSLKSCNIDILNREADEWQIYKKWLGKGRIQAGIEDFLCFNDLDKGEDGDLDLNFCGRAGKKEGLEDYSGSSSYSSSLEDELEENKVQEKIPEDAKEDEQWQNLINFH